MRRTMLLVICLVCLLSAANVLSAQESDRSVFARGGFVHQMDADIDGGGDFSVNRFFIQTGADFPSGPGSGVSLALGYGFDSYDFSSNTVFGNRQPWDDIQSFRVSVPWRWGINEKWTGLVSPTLRYTGEKGADLNDALTGGGIAAFSYRYSDRLSIGPGVVIMTQLEDNAQVIPILIVRWKITDTVSLQTDRGIGATQGPGLTLVWRPNREWAVSLGGRYEKRRFRLAEDGAVSNGIGEDRSFPVFAGLEYRFSPKISMAFTGGMEFGGELRLENSDGDTLVEEDHDSVGFLGFSFNARF